MPVVDIPEFGTVEFPDSMSLDEISSASADLYDEHVTVPKRRAAIQGTEFGRFEQAASLGPAGPIGDIKLQQVDKEIPGFTEGVINSYKRGNLAAQRAIEAMQIKPGAVQPRMALAAKAKAFGMAMEDPAYMARLTEASAIEDPEVRAAATAKVEELYGPEGRYQRGAVSPLREAQTATQGMIARTSREMEAIPKSEVMQEWDKADNTNWYKVLARNPVQVIANVFAESIPQMAPSMAGFMAAGPVAGAAGSFGAEYANSILDAAANQGVDLTKEEQVRDFFTDENKVKAAKEFAVKRGVPIALLDYATMKIAGKILSPVIGKGVTKVTAATAGELGVQMAGGGLGEAAAQVTTGQPFDIKAIASEAIAELASAPAEVAGNLRGEVKIRAEQTAFEKAMNEEFDRVSKMAAQEAALEATLPVSRGTIDLVAANAAASGAPATAAAVTDANTTLAPTGETADAIRTAAGQVLPDVQAQPGKGEEAVPGVKGPGEVAPPLGKTEASPVSGPEEVKFPLRPGTTSQWEDQLGRPVELVDRPEKPGTKMWSVVRPKPATEGGEAPSVQEQEKGKEGLQVAAPAAAAEPSATGAAAAPSLTPAIAVGDKTFTGTSHKDILEKGKKAFADKEITMEEYMGLVEAFADDARHVFQTADGKVLNRAEAGAEFDKMMGNPPGTTPALQSEMLPKPETFADKVKAANAITNEELLNVERGPYGIGGATAYMWSLGAQAKTPEDVAALRKMAEESSAKVKDLMDVGTPEAMDEAQRILGRQPMEAYEFATGVKLDGMPKWKMFENRVPGYVPPVPDQKYLEAKKPKEPIPSKTTALPVEMKASDYPDPKHGEPDLVLLGCVDKKKDTKEPVPAADLYVSPLFRARREFAESDTRPWMILSAAHGVIEPGKLIEPYDTSLDQLSAAEKEEWKRNVRGKILEYFGGRNGTVGSSIEVHAGSDYVKALNNALEGLGVTVAPAFNNREGIGTQLSIYKKGYERPVTSGGFGSIAKAAMGTGTTGLVSAGPTVPPTVLGAGAATTPAPGAIESPTAPARQTEPTPIDYSESAAKSRAAWRDQLNPTGPGVGSRWGAIENTYIAAKAATDAMPGIPLKDIFGIGVKAGPYPDSKVVDYFFVHRNSFQGLLNDPEFLKQYPPGKFTTTVEPGFSVHNPRKGEPKYNEWLAGKRPTTEKKPEHAPVETPAPPLIIPQPKRLDRNKVAKIVYDLIEGNNGPDYPLSSINVSSVNNQVVKKHGVSIQTVNDIKRIIFNRLEKTRTSPSENYFSDAKRQKEVVRDIQDGFEDEAISSLTRNVTAIEVIQPERARPLSQLDRRRMEAEGAVIGLLRDKMPPGFLDAMRLKAEQRGLTEEQYVAEVERMVEEATRDKSISIQTYLVSAGPIELLGRPEAFWTQQNLYTLPRETLDTLAKSLGITPSAKLKPFYVADILEKANELLDKKRPAKPEPTKAKKKKKGGGYASRIEGEGEVGTAPDIFAMEDEDLEEYLDAQFPRTETSGLEARPTGYFVFPDYDAFKVWMDARYAERDLEGMQMAFAEAPSSHKVAYIKETNRAGDEHKKAWLAHMATGSPLPAEDPPVTRTTPRPEPSGAPPRTPYTGPSGEPRPPTGREKFDTMALVQFLRQFDKSPRVNTKLYRAYGRYVPGSSQVELMKNLFWDTKLAERVLAHEIGHFVDLFLMPGGHGLPFAERLSPLRMFRAYIHLKKQWRDEAKNLSRAWRGPFTNANTYRNSASELFADFMSAMLNDPQWVNQNFPILYDAFAELLAGKPDFRLAYDEMTRWLKGGTMVGEWRQQQGENVQKTMDILMEEKPQHKQPLADILKSIGLSVWHRAYQKEGNPTGIGDAISDDLEYSNMWSATQNSLFEDDFKKHVQPFIEKIDPDIIKARTLLHQYTQAVRTIGERRAAGVWIENNPDEARLILQTILNMDPTIRQEFLNQLNTAQNSQLYDLSAAIFRAIHQKDMVHRTGGTFARKIAKAIDDLDLGVEGENALLAFNVRGNLLNPGGLTVGRAQEVLAEQVNELNPDQWDALETAARNLRDMFFNVQEQAYNEGLISQKTWNEIIEPNVDNYLPYAVLEHFEGKVAGGIKQQIGTAKDIADVTLATQLKVATLNAWRQSQRQVQLLRDVYQAGGVSIPIGEKLKSPLEIDNIRRKHSDDDISRAVLWQDGKPYLVEFPADAGKSFEKAMNSKSFYSHMEWLTKLGRVTHGIMQLYTTFSLPFMLYRNPTRGLRTNMTRTGGWVVGKEAAKEAYGLAQAIASGLDPKSAGWAELGKAGQMAVNYAQAAFGGVMSPEVRDLVERQVLLPPRLSSAMVRDADNLLELIKNGGIMAYQVEKAKEQGWPWWKKYAPTRQSVKFAEQVFTVYEAFEKIYTYNSAIEKGVAPEKAKGVAIRAGIPKPGVGGHFSPMMEVFLPWVRVKTQGLRASLDTMRDPELQKGYAARWAIWEGIPRIAKVIMAAGLATGAISWLYKIRDDEDDKDPVMSEVFRRVSPYKMALDDVVPLMFYDPRKGEYHYFNEFKSGRSVPEHYEVVSFRIPASEEGREFGPLLYNMLASRPDIVEKVGRPGETPITAFGNWLQNQMLPSLNPAIVTGKNLYEMIAVGKNPDDPFRGQPSANKVMFDAGGSERAEAIIGYALNQLGGPGEIAAIMAMNFGLLDERATTALKQRIASDKVPLVERIPVAKNMLSYDNYAQYREEGWARKKEEEIRAKTRVVMSAEVRQIYDYYWKNYERQEKLDVQGKQLFAVAEDFHRRWGSLDDRGSLYARTASVVTRDSSRQSKESARKDLDMASTPYIARWNLVMKRK